MGSARRDSCCPTWRYSRKIPSRVLMRSAGRWPAICVAAPGIPKSSRGYSWRRVGCGAERCAAAFERARWPQIGLRQLSRNVEMIRGGQMSHLVVSPVMQRSRGRCAYRWIYYILLEFRAVLQAVENHWYGICCTRPDSLFSMLFGAPEAREERKCQPQERPRTDLPIC